MTNQDNHPKESADLRQKAEALARERAARTPENSADLSPEEIRRMFHELRVYQIELEIMNNRFFQITVSREKNILKIPQPVFIKYLS